MAEILQRIVTHIMKLFRPGIFLHDMEEGVGLVFVMSGFFRNVDVGIIEKLLKSGSLYLIALGQTSPVGDQDRPDIGVLP